MELAAIVRPRPLTLAVPPLCPTWSSPTGGFFRKSDPTSPRVSTSDMNEHMPDESKPLEQRIAEYRFQSEVSSRGDRRRRTFSWEGKIVLEQSPTPEQPKQHRRNRRKSHVTLQNL